MKGKKIRSFSAIFIIVIVIGILISFYFCRKNNFIIKDTLPNGNGREAKIILLAGQSNAAGCSHDKYLQQNVSKNKYLEYENGYNNVYINYFCSNKNVSSAFVKCRNKQGHSNKLFGPELGLAEELNRQYPDQLFFIIKYTWGGTNLYDEWLSPSSNGKTGKLYNQFVDFTEKSIMYLVSKNYNVSIEGLCWMQGESDSFSVENATNYESNLLNFINDIRKKFFKYASSDGIAFIDAEIADNPSHWVYCDLVNKSKQNVAESSTINVLINTNEEGLTCSNEPIGNVDMAHYDSLSEIKLGHLFAEYISKFFDK